MRAMALKVRLEQGRVLFITVLFLGYLSCKVICETGDCRQQEFKDRSGNCVLCKQCGPGMELSKNECYHCWSVGQSCSKQGCDEAGQGIEGSKHCNLTTECGFGYGEDAQCVPCRPHRFKEDWGFQKCKPCVDCALVNRFQRANCSHTSDAICGDCLPGFYRKTKLVGFQDMECVPCGDPPPPYEPHCTSKVNLVKISSTASSPRDTALAAVICSALATVLLALLILCVIYCKRQFMEKKPSWSLRSQDIQYNGSELSCFEQPRLRHCAHRACCQCHRDSAQTYGPVHLIPSVCCEEARSSACAALACGLHSTATLQERNAASVGDTMPAFFGSVSRSICGEFSDGWPLMRNPMGGDISLCDSYPELIGEDINSLNPEKESSTSLDSSSGQDLAGTAARDSSGNFTETTDSPRGGGTVWEQTLAQDAQRTASQGGWEGSGNLNLATPASFQDA